MNALNVAEYTHSLGLQAKTASALMAKAPAAIKNKALKALARLLRENVAALQVDNAKDLERAVANGLAGPMVDRLKLTPFTQALQAFERGDHTAAALSTLARQQTTLLAALPPRYSEVLLNLLDRLESSALFSEESCSFSQKDLVANLTMWMEKAQGALNAS